MKKIAALALSFLLLSSCGLRQEKVRQQIAEQSQEADSAHQQAQTFSDQDAARAQQDFEARRAYFYALAGDYTGSFSLKQAVPNGAPSPAPSAQPAFPLPSATSTAIYVQITVQNDADDIPTNQDVTADQVNAEANALTLNVNVIEETNARNSAGQPVSARNECAETGVKPDLKTGEITFSCQSSAGRNYVFSLSDAQGEAADSGTDQNALLANSINESNLLVSGKLDKVSAMAVQISTSFSQNFFGTLSRSGS